MTSPRDKRLFPRRPTAPVSVLLSHDAGANLTGIVLDYSPAGLTIQVNQPIPASTVLRVQCARAGTDVLEAEVVRCLAHDGSWQLGCRFNPPRHWDDLWMFSSD
jgi:hypothetical protein